MIFAKVDVKLRDHVKAQRAGAAMATWTWGLLYAREQETDGYIPLEAVVRSWCPEALEHADKLVEVGLWEVAEGGWQINGYASKNDTRAQIEDKRRSDRERKRSTPPPPPVHPPSARIPIGTRVESDGTPLGGGGGSVAGIPGSRSSSRSGSDLDLEGGAGGARPEWFDQAVDSAETSTGEAFDRGTVWLKYQATRERDGRAPGAADLRGFLASWASRQKSERVQAREREQTRAKGRGGGPRGDRQPLGDADNVRRMLAANSDLMEDP